MRELGPRKTPVPKSIVPETRLAAVSGTETAKATTTTATNAPLDDSVTGKAATTLKADPSLAGLEGDTEAPWKSPVPKSKVPETRLAVVSATTTKKATPITVTADAPECGDHGDCQERDHGNESHVDYRRPPGRSEPR